MMSAEISPFVKVGGLADVVGSLPKELKKMDCDVRLIMPLYKTIDKKKFQLKKITKKEIKISSGNKYFDVNIWETHLPETKVLVYFLDCPKFFSSKEIYEGAKKDSEKFLFFSYASLFSLPTINFFPDIIHCHDSHTAMVPDLLKTSTFQFLKNIKTLYTIHNFCYQGKTEKDVLSIANLKKDSLKSLQIDCSDEDVNFTVQGILNADLINTVSEKYAREILTKEYGEGLEKIIRKRQNDLHGIVNGIDLDFFDPKNDKYLKKKFDKKSIHNKIINKLYLQRKLKLEIDENIAMASMITRFTSQKGIDLFSEKFIEFPCQFVFLGTGEKKYENQIKKLAKKYPRKISANITFDISLAQKIYASSDIFLMPSIFEPCGLGQLIAMRYGTVPVVRATGGLDDTVDETLGFKFSEKSSEKFYNSLKNALNVYYNEPKKWNVLRNNCMKKDFSWNKSALKYLELYNKLIEMKEK